MAKRALTFAIFVACFLLAISGDTSADGLKRFRNGNTDVRQHSPANREELRARKLLHKLIGNNEDKSDSSSRIQYVRGLFDLRGRSANPKASVDDSMVKAVGNVKGKNVISDAERIKRSATQPQKALPAFLLYTVGYEIRKLTLHDGVETTLVHWKGLDGSQALYIDFHYKQDRMYWADAHSIHRAFLNGSGVETIFRYLPAVNGLAVDWLGDNIYWIDQKYIMVSKTDGRFRKSLVRVDQSNSHNEYAYRSIALDPERGYVYWFYLWKDLDDDSKREDSVIKRAPMYKTDATGEVVLRRDVYVNTHFAIDYSDQKLYWTSATLILRHNLDPDHIKFFKSLVLSGLQNPASLSVFEQYIYWVDWKTNSILRANKTDGSLRQTIRRNISMARSLKVVHKDIQKAGYNLCSTLGHCSHLCLLDPVNFFRCECPDTMYLRKVSCVCPSGQFINQDGECRYRNAPWNVTATPLDNAAIKLSWSPPKDGYSSQPMYYIFYGIFPHDVSPWPVGRTSATTFVVGHLENSAVYVFAVSLGLKGRKSTAVKCKPKSVPAASPTPTSASSCPVGWLYCQLMPFGVCIKTESLCDGKVDCPQGWDEQPENCPTLPAVLLYITGDEIRKLTLNAVETTLVNCKGLENFHPLYVDFHYKENRLYWADSNSIHRSFLNGSGVETIFRYLPAVNGLAVDWLGDNIYWIDQKYIMVSKTDGRFRKSLLKLEQNSGGDEYFYKNIALDPERGYMYWFRRHSYNGYRGSYEKYEIQEAGMYESSGYSLFNHATSAFAIDYSDQKLYWASLSEIQCYNMDSRNVKFFKSVILAGINPKSLSVFEEYIYWDDIKTKSIQRAHKTDGSSRQTINASISEAKSLKVVHRNMQKGYDLCSTLGRCSHLCLPDPVNLYRCECPDTMKTVRHSNGTVTCLCPRGQFLNWDGECRYEDAPWNVTATPLNNTAIRLTWLPPKDRQSGQMMYYIFYGIFPHGISHWPVGGTTSTTFVVGNLKENVVYVFEVSSGLKRHHSVTVKSKPKSASPATTASPTPTSASSCPAGWLYCQLIPSGVCIKTESLCDGKVDCPQAWDEQPHNCPITSTPAGSPKPTSASSCPVGWLHCQLMPSGVCIKTESLCDGKVDCPQGWDEQPENCPNISLQVRNVQASALPYGTSVIVTWRRISYKPPGVSTKYRTSYRAISRHFMQVSDDWHVEDTQSINYYIVSGLQQCSKYEFRIQVLIQGSPPGPYSAIVNTTTAKTQTSAPKNVQHTLKGDDGVQISWEAPASYCHVITNYKVHYKPITKANFQAVETGNVLSYFLTGLTAGATYLIKVQAYSVDGGGLFSDLQAVVIPQAPASRTTASNVTPAANACPDNWLHCQHIPSGVCIKMESLCDGKADCPQAWDEQPENCPRSAPGQLMARPYNNTAVILSWMPPKKNPSGQRVYYIYFGTASAGVSSVPVGSTTGRNFVVGNLQQTVVYAFEVSLGLTGRHSDHVYSKPKSVSDYQSVHNLKAVVVNSSSIFLTWEKPVDITDSSVIKGYRIMMSYREEPGIASAYYYNTTGRTNNHSYKYLNFSTTYTFEVRVRFSEGDVLGEAVHVAITTEPFSAPVGLLVKTLHDTTVMLSWSAPRTIDLKKSLKFYSVYWNCSGCYYQSRGRVNIDKAISYTFTNLHRSATYTYTVHAETTFGIGENSTTSVTIARVFAQVRNLRARIGNNYTMTVQWDAPSGIDSKDIKCYVTSWCNLCTKNVTKGLTQFKMAVFAGDTYNINVRAVTNYGLGVWTYIQKSVPPLKLQVSSVYASNTGRYGLQVHLSWNKPYSGEHLKYVVKWHCIRGTGSCYWTPYHGWTTRTVNATSFTSNMGSYNKAYLFEITVTTPHGKGLPYQVTTYIPPLNGMPRSFACNIAKESAQLICHWEPPTDVNPVGFNYYGLKFKCDNCEFSWQHARVYGFNLTSVNISLIRDARLSVAMIQVNTTHGSGKWAETTVPTRVPTRVPTTVTTTIKTRPTVPASIGPVTQLSASLDNNNPSLVHLSWKALSPSGDRGLKIDFHINITCQDCSPPQSQIQGTGNEKFSARLRCGHTYLITVRAFTVKGSGGESQVVVLIPSVFATVKNLRARFKKSGSEKGFLVEWDPVKGLSGSDTMEYDVLVTRKSSVLFHHRTSGTQMFVRSPDPTFGEKYTFGIACQTVCGYGERINLTIYYPELPLPSTPTQWITQDPSLSPSSTIATHTTRAMYTTGARYWPTKPSSSFPRQSHPKNKRYTRWLLPVAIVIAGLVFVVIVVYLVRRHIRRVQYKRTVANLPYYPQDYVENTREDDERPLMLGDLTDDEALITA